MHVELGTLLSILLVLRSILQLVRKLQKEITNPQCVECADRKQRMTRRE
jgi:hypothetical protein